MEEAMIGTGGKLYRKMIGRLCLALLVLPIGIGTAVAQTEAGVALAKPAEEQRVVIRSSVQKGQSVPTLGGSILLKATGQAAAQLRLRSSPLQLAADPHIAISRGDVSIPATTIEPGQAADVRVSVANIPRAGIYSGRLFFWVGTDKSRTLEVPISLEIAVRPALVLVGPAPQWNLVRCEWRWICWLPQKTVSASATQDAQPFKLENQSALPIEQLDFLTLLRGNNTKSSSAAREVKVTPPGGIAANGVADVDVAVSRNQLDADSY
jgi:hypothetical protein